MCGQILAAMLFEPEPLPSRPFVIVQKLSAGLGGFFIQQVIWICAPKVEFLFVHGYGSYPG
jgi:hypothetical protein